MGKRAVMSPPSAVSSAIIPCWDVSDAITDKRLVRVLADWQFDSAPINLLVPSRKLRSPRVQTLVAFLEEALKA
ncbi:LysR substrate binding domain-containing protein [Pseudomonas sp. NFACC52]|nr:LysR substrate binding domain-containing protein [Pseudomonas sp. NFACC56-3]SFK15733.1 LysR substrate binding domain-containing protein [Pseudomonas sp. NFACC52]